MKQQSKATRQPERPDAGEALRKTWKNFLQSIPIILGVLLTISLVLTAIPPSALRQLFTGHPVKDPFIGALVGSISSGNPLTSYIFGGELLREGVTLFAVTAFIVSWVTVGVVQLPAEAMMLGKRYALTRNSVSFLMSILVAIVTVILVRWI